MKRKKGEKSIKEILEDYNDEGKKLYIRLNYIWQEAEDIQQLQESEDVNIAGPKHCKVVEEHINKLLLDNFKKNFKPIELFFLSLAVCFHDIGKHDNDSQKDHGKLSEEFIKKNYSKYGLNQMQAFIIGKIMSSHSNNETFSNLNETLTYESDDIKIKKLASILKLADTLHTYSTRIKEDLFEINQTKNSKEKEKFRKSIIGWDFDDDDSNIIRLEIPVIEEIDEENIKVGVSKMNKEIKPAVKYLEEMGLPIYFSYRLIKTNSNQTKQVRGSEGSFDNEKDIIENIKILKEAFNLEGRTRLIYTCRSVFDKLAYRCPSDITNIHNNNLNKSLLSHFHIPVDEIETFDLSLYNYDNLILMKENQIQDALICSKKAFEFLINSYDNETIYQGFLDNLIIIGENIFSNYIFHLISYELPWRHIIFQECVKFQAEFDKNFKKNLLFSFDIPIDSKYHVGPYFNFDLGFNIENHVKEQMKNGYNWAIITYICNPFFPDHYFLFLIGCHRMGQYMLNSWLRSQTSVDTLRKIKKIVKNKKVDFIQIAIMGKSLNEIELPYINREWNFESIIDISSSNNKPFFINKEKNLFYTKIENQDKEDIVDFSLLVKINPISNTVDKIKSTLPNSLIKLFNDEIQSEAGLHITLFEFIHRKGKDYDARGFVEDILNRDSNFFKKIQKEINKIPEISIILRQTKATDTSVHILADFCISKNFQLIENYDDYKYIVNILEVINKICQNAIDELSPTDQNRFNIRKVPFPPHFTLIRFLNNVSNENLNLIKDWAEKYKNKIWGQVKIQEFSLSRALKHYNDIKQEIL